ncbi:MAG: 1-acyl-sn-glycerol-3-phosphate acyltransferase [Betaproteobacteria bacterium]|nr:1-acyl-sn-glycerol-3-phosphate acyltransferase [Betaproteobacteria bacterium]
MAALRSLLHLFWMLVTVIPVALYLLACAVLGASGHRLYRIARFWLWLSIVGAKTLLGIRYVVEGWDNLPTEDKPAVLLVKHQSTYETFLMPVIMPRDLAYVFKKELLYVPFFGWAIGKLDMIHIDRRMRKQAFHKVSQLGQALLQRGVWVIMFPEGTRIARGKAGEYKSGGTRLAIDAGVPVVPIAVNSGVCWPRKAFIKSPGLVTVSVGKPIDSVGRDPDELMAEVQQWIETEMHRLDPQAYLEQPGG